MNRTFFILIMFASFSWANNADDEMNLSHEGHLHEEMVDGEKLEVDPERFDRFVENLKNMQVAVVNVHGIVCDFCAQGIQRTFEKDINVKKIDVDLRNGKVLVAYAREENINFDDIKQKILINGQNAVGMKIIIL
jgi:hypothetical protein